MNPALNDKTFSGIGYTEERMTVSGVINKSIVLWMILAVGAYLGWKNPAITVPFNLHS